MAIACLLVIVCCQYWVLGSSEAMFSAPPPFVYFPCAPVSSGRRHVILSLWPYDQELQESLVLQLMLSLCFFFFFLVILCRSLGSVRGAEGSTGMPAATSAKWPFISSLLPVRLKTPVRLVGVHEPCPFSGWTLRVWVVAVCVSSPFLQNVPLSPGTLVNQDAGLSSVVWSG